MFIEQDIQITEGPLVQVLVEVGFAQHCDFDCRLFDAEGNNPQLVHSGSTLQSDPPPFVINVPGTLTGRFMMTKATVQNLGGNQFAVRVTFSQGGQPVGHIQAAGEFTDVKTVSLVAKFV